MQKRQPGKGTQIFLEIIVYPRDSPWHWRSVVAATVKNINWNILTGGRFGEFRRHLQLVNSLSQTRMVRLCDAGVVLGQSRLKHGCLRILLP